MKNAYKLKGSNTSVQNDYSRDTLRKRKLLWHSASEERQQKRKVNLIHEKLRIDNNVFVWDDTENARVKLESTTILRKTDFTMQIIKNSVL